MKKSLLLLVSAFFSVCSFASEESSEIKAQAEEQQYVQLQILHSLEQEHIVEVYLESKLDGVVDFNLFKEDYNE